MAMAKSKKILMITACAGFTLILLLTAAYHIALSSTVICSFWLPMAGRMTRSTMTASEVKMSLLRSSLEVRDFCYANPHGVELRVESLKTGIAFFPLFSRDIRIHDAALRGLHLKLRPAAADKDTSQAAIVIKTRSPNPNRSVPASSAPVSREPRIPLIAKPFRIPESLLGWKQLPFKLALRDLSVHDLSVDYAAADGTEFRCAADSLALNRITPGMTSELRVDSILTGVLKTHGIEMISLPLSFSCKMLLDSALFPETMDLSADFHQEKQSPRFILSICPGQPFTPEKMRLLLRGKRGNGKWTLEQVFFSMGKSTLKASGDLEPRLNNASVAWGVKLYPAELPQPLPLLIRNSGIEASYLEENGRLSFLNGKLEYSDILTASGFKLDENGTPAGDLSCSMNYIVSADIPGGVIGLSNAELNVSEGEAELLTLRSRNPLKFYRTREGFLPDPGMVPDFQFRMRETPLPRLNLFLKGRKFRRGTAALTATATADAQRNILLNASLSVREKHKGKSAAEIALSASLDLAGTTRPDAIRISSSGINLPLLREILPQPEIPGASPPSDARESAVTEKAASVPASAPVNPPAPAGEKAILPERKDHPGDRLSPFLRDGNFLLTLDLRSLHCADGAELALSGDISLKERILSGENLLLRINGTAFPLRLESDLAKERFRIAGSTGKLNAGPLINLLLRQKSASLTVDSLKFDLSGEGFTPERIKRTLTGSFVAGGSGISVPLELDQSSDLLKLVMIPLENIPSLLGLIGGSDLKNLALEKTQGLASVLNGSAALSFSSANLDASIRNGVVTVRDFTLSGDLILTETVLGTVNLASGGINLKTRTSFDIITFPLDFGGTISSPVPDLPNAVADFLKLNASATLQKSVNRFLDKALNTAEEDVEDLEQDGSALDRTIDKGIQKGLRSLDKWLNRQKK